MLLLINKLILNAEVVNASGTLIIEAVEEAVSWLKSQSKEAITGYVTDPYTLTRQLRYLGNERAKCDLEEDFENVIMLTQQIALLERLQIEAEKINEEYSMYDPASYYDDNDWKDFHIN